MVNGSSQTSTYTMTTSNGFKIDGLTSTAANQSMYFIVFSWQDGTW